MKKLLLVNANVNRGTSRTQRLTDAFMELLIQHEEVEVEELILEELVIAPLDSELLNRRYALIEAGETDADDFEYARQWRDADIIVISTPLWLFTYPAKLKAYLEAVDVIGIAYDFLPDGSTKSYCKATDLYYITTVGGPSEGLDYGFNTIEAFAGAECRIPNIRCIVADNLDMVP
ncbi:MAG: NAD(P)H-dependent oxidoreductase, partial [Atopobiaceae bacterium]|nr:NAD(P)H-dependent oxidoreductase [Atopobiaceae bacterium]